MIRLTYCLYQLDACLQCNFSRDGILARQPVSTDISPNPYGAIVCATHALSCSQARAVSAMHNLFQPCTTGTRKFCRPASEPYLCSTNLYSNHPVQTWRFGKQEGAVLGTPSSVKPGLPAESEQPARQSACRRERMSHACAQLPICIPVHAGIRAVCQLCVRCGTHDSQLGTLAPTH